MARTKKEVVEETVEKKEKNITEDNLLAKLSKQLEDMQERLNALAKENEKLKQEANEKEEVSELTADTDIPVVSLTMGKLVVSTLGNGLGTVYRFEEFGQVQDIPFGDLKDIVKNKPNFARGGAYYIADKDAVKKLRLTRDYENIISDKMFSVLLDQNANVVVEAYKTAPKLQQEQVVGMIEDKLENGVEIDANILVKIGKLCGKNFTKEVEEE